MASHRAPSNVPQWFIDTAKAFGLAMFLAGLAVLVLIFLLLIIF